MSSTKNIIYLIYDKSTFDVYETFFDEDEALQVYLSSYSDHFDWVAIHLKCLLEINNLGN